MYFCGLKRGHLATAAKRDHVTVRFRRDHAVLTIFMFYAALKEATWTQRQKGIMYGQGQERSRCFNDLHVLCGQKKRPPGNSGKKASHGQGQERSGCFNDLYVLCGLKRGHLATVAKRDHVTVRFRRDHAVLTIFMFYAA
jgi:hypothetical protein